MPAAARPVGGVDYPRTYQESSRPGSPTMPPAANIWETCAGRMASSARNAAAEAAGAPARAVDVRRVRQEDLGDGRHDLSPFAHAAVDLVRRGLVRHLTEERRLRARPERRAGVRLV